VELGYPADADAMTRLPLGLTLTVVIGASAPAGAAPGPAGLTVSRDAGASDCPEAPALAAAINRGLGREGITDSDPEGAALRFSVAFGKQAGGYDAVISAAGARHGQRALSDTGASCAALGDAVGVLLVLLLDGGGELEPAPAAPTPTWLSLGAGGGLAEGATGGWAAAFTGTATLRFGARWAVRAGGTFVPARSSAFGPGVVEVGLGYGRVALCWSPVGRRPRWELALCAQPELGVLTGSGAGYELENHAVRRPWIALGGGAALTGTLVGRLGWDVEVTASRPLTEERFVVTSVGTAYASPAVSLMSTVSLHAVIW
jgi:hypothetical protein